MESRIISQQEQKLYNKLLTGDELTINDKCYLIKYNNGCVFYLGKLLKREKSYSYFYETYSNYNNIFEFENMPDKKLVQNYE
jgi:hypothetical protein